MKTELYAPLATVIAALLAATIGFLGIVLTKETKVSEFRQSWIDSLRDEISEMVANLLLTLKYIERYGEQAIEKEAYQASILKANMALYSVRLRLNPKEPASQDMLATLDEIEEFSVETEFPPSRVHDLERQLIQQSKVVLKNEWDRVQKGETTYQITKWSFVTLAVALGIFGIALFTQASPLESPKESSTQPEQLAPPSTQNLAQCGWLSDTSCDASSSVAPMSKPAS